MISAKTAIYMNENLESEKSKEILDKIEKAVLNNLENRRIILKYHIPTYIDYYLRSLGYKVKMDSCQREGIWTDISW